MLKIVVFGFYGPDQSPARPLERDAYCSPVTTGEFMRTAWELEPPESRVGVAGVDPPSFAKLTHIASQPVYIQSLSRRLTPGAASLNADGYVAIIDAVKILAPRTIKYALQRLYELQPPAHLLIAAGRQNEPEALSSDEIREILGLHPDLPIYPYVPSEPKTVARMLRRLARYIEDPLRTAPPVFAGTDTTPKGAEVAPGAPPAPADPPAGEADSAAVAERAYIHGLAHVAVTVSDLGRALDFYRGLLGFRVLGQLEYPNDPRGFMITYLDAGHGVIKLFSHSQTATQPPLPSDNTRLGLQSIALRVTGLDMIAEQLMCAGVSFTMTPTEGVSRARIAYLTDPDGTLIELIEGEIHYTRR